MSVAGDPILPEFQTRRLAYYLSIYQEKILSTDQVTDRIQLLDVNLNKWIGFPSLNLAMDYVIAASSQPISAQTLN